MNITSKSIAKSLLVCGILSICSWLPLQAAINPIVISEVFYDSPLKESISAYDSIPTHHNGEYIELYNPTSDSVDISGWQLRDGTTGYIFPTSTKIASGSMLLVAYRYPGSNFELSTLFPSVLGKETSILYQSKMYLANKGEIIKLSDKAGRVIDWMCYRSYSTTPGRLNYWNINARNGEGKPLEQLRSLQRVDIHTTHSSILAQQEDYDVSKATPLDLADDVILPKIGTLYDLNEVNINNPVGVLPGAAGVSPTGAATYEIPIDVPQGTNNTQPKVSIVYNSQGGLGALGQGWDISGLSAISRTTQSLYYDAVDGKVDTTTLQFTDMDRLALDGQRLIVLGGASYWAENSIYGTEVETFGRVQLKTSERTRLPYFVVKTREGTTMEYGGTPDALVRNAAIENDTRILSWKLNKITDVHSNSVQYEYTDDGQYIKTITYAGGSLSFNYDSIGTYPSKRYIRNFLIERNKFLQNIVVKSGNDTVHSYQLIYDVNLYDRHLDMVSKQTADSLIIASLSIDWGKESEIQEVNVCPAHDIQISSITNTSLYAGDIDGDGLTDIIDLWEGDEANNEQGFIGVTLRKTNTTLPLVRFPSCTKNHSNFHPQLAIADYNNDGKDEMALILEDSLELYALANDGSTLQCKGKRPYFASYDGVNNWKRIENSNDFTSTMRFSPFIFNINNDQYPELGIVPFKLLIGQYRKAINYEETFNYPGYPYAETGDLIGECFKGGVNLLTDTSTLTPFPTPYMYGYMNAPVWGDFDANGIPDLLHIHPMHFHDFTYINKITQRGISAWTDQLFYLDGFNKYIKPRYDYCKSMDVNSDGLTDLIVKLDTGHDDKWFALINNGGVGQTPIREFKNLDGAASPQAEKLNERYDFYLVDYNGDGQTDIVIGDENCMGGKYPRFDRTDWTFYRNVNGTFRQEKKITWKNWRRLPKMNPVMMDVNGDGITDLVFGDSTRYIAFTKPQANKANLVHAIADGLGNVERFTYQNYGNYNQTPTVDPIRNVKAPLTVVASFQSKDNTVTTYTYEDAKAHKTKGFLGFQKVTASSLLGGTQKTTITEYEIDTTFFMVNVSQQQVMQGGQLISTSTQKNRIIIADAVKKRYVPVVDWQKVTDGLTNVTQMTSYSYDNNYNVVRQAVSDGISTVITTMAYIPRAGGTIPYLPQSVTTTHKRTDATDSVSTVVTYTYTDKGLPATKTEFGGEVVTTYAYEPCGALKREEVAATDCATQTREYGYDDYFRFVESTTNTLDQSATATYDYVTGHKLSETGIDGLTTRYEYDLLGHVKKKTLPNGEVIESFVTWETAYGSTYKIRTQSSATPDVTTAYYTFYNHLGQEVFKEEPGFKGKTLISNKIYTAKGQLWEETAPHSAEETPILSTYQYDDFGRITSKTLSDGTDTLVTRYSYNQLTSTITLSDRQTRTTVADASGAVISRTDNGGGITYKYNAANQPIEITAAGGTTHIEYDAKGNQTKLIDPNAGTISYTYYPDGQMKTQTNARNHVTTMTYDEVGRPKTKSVVADHTYLTTYTYVPSGNGVGQLQSEELKTDGSITNVISYTYNQSHLLVAKGETYVGLANPLVTTFEYDSLWRPVKTTTPSGVVTENVYDAYGDITVVKANDNTIWEQTALSRNFESIQLGNGYTTEKTYDNFGRCTSLFSKTERFLAGRKRTVFAQNATYTYDPLTSNLLSRNDLINERSELFEYDVMNRLTLATLNADTLYQMTYALNGNIDTKTDVGKYLYQSSRPHAITNIDGTLGTGISADTIQTLTYSYFNKVTSVEQGADRYNIFYGIDNQRRKSETLVGGVVKHTRYYFGAYEIDVDSLGNVTQTDYLYTPSGLTALYKTTSDTTLMYYVHLDHLGSIAAITNTNKGVVSLYAYTPWGGRLLLSGTNITDRGYTLHEHIEAFGLIDMSGRMYDPVLARFLSPDPYVQAPDFTQSFNRYAYCWNNPLSYTDPSGEFIFTGLLAPIGLAPLGVIIDAACWGAVIGGVGYTANVAMSYDGFAGWDWGQFGKAVGVGAISGAVTAGIGQVAGPIGSGGLIGELGRAYVHGYANGMISTLTGGDFMQGFSSGILSSFAGSAFMMYGGQFANSTLGVYAFSVVSGGIAAELTGGNFWEGAAIGLMTAGLNHLQSVTGTAGSKYYSNKKAGYRDMWKNSFVNGKPAREVSAWELENGDLIMLPYDKNNRTTSCNDALTVGRIKGKLHVQFNGEYYPIKTHVHTHPTQASPTAHPIGLSTQDLRMQRTVGNPIHILYNKAIYSIDGTYNYATKVWNYKYIGTW